jgi:alpha-ketoglutaric semialdehyde dehydrogenase
MAQQYENYIDGAWVAPGSGDYFEQRNPAKPSEITGLYPASGADDARAAIDAAERAFAGWKATNVVRRAEILRDALDLMRDRSREIARILTSENGKTLAESSAEINAAVREMDYQIAQGIRAIGETVPLERNGVFGYSVREPLGVVSVISPWNFPFNVPGRKCVPALVAGNTCVFKPASLTPRTGIEFVKLFADAGLPAGVLNLVTGSGRKVGTPFITDARIKAVSFTGSTEVGIQIQEVAAPRLVRTQLELGGKNPAVVLEDADLEAAAKAIVTAAYACAGQWCTSTSRAIVVEEIYDRFLEMLTERAKTIVVGDGADTATGMGPVCGKEQFGNILKAIDQGKTSGARLVMGGNPTKAGGGAAKADAAESNGYFIEPTIFADVDPQSDLAQEEIFGPVLSVIRAKDFDEAVEIANGVRYGLCSSIFTSDLERAHRFLERTDVGLTHVNMMTALKEPQLTFGGRKESGFGIPEAGGTGIEFFTQHKVAYINYGGGA